MTVTTVIASAREKQGWSSPAYRYQVKVVSWGKLFGKIKKSRTCHGVRCTQEFTYILQIAVPEYGLGGVFASDPVKGSSVSKRSFRL